MDDSEITCDEIIESCEEDADAEAKSNEEAKSVRETKTISTNFNKKKQPVKTRNIYILLAFLFISIALLLVFTVM